ncbi:MAG: hypothetical protein ACI30N_03825 [Muribaculaceae bacterium]
MNILMVGHSGSGKTSFMAGMYKYLGEEKNGYGISAKKPSQKTQLQRMAQGLEHGRYPAGTDVQSRYEFAFTVHGEELMPFNWIDYRGGILLSDDPDDGDIDKFMGAIKKADALIVFLDGQKLIQPGARWNMEYDILLSCIERSLTVEHKSWFPISFVITKCDIVPNGVPFHGLQRFYNLFSQIEKNQKVGGMLLQCAINRECYHLPFLALAYCIYGGSSIYINRCVDSINKARAKAETHRPTSFIGKVFGVGEQIFKEVFDIVDMGWETEYEKTWAAERSEKELGEQFERLKACADELKDKLIKFREEYGLVDFM